MEVLLLQDFPQLGFIGDKMNVKNGYARNYLVPRGIAIEASSRNAKELQHRMAMVEAKKAKKKQEAVDLQAKLQEVELEFKLKLGEGGKSFGSISNRDIEGALTAKGFTLDRRQIVLAEPIRTPGDVQVTARLHSEVEAKITVHVIADKPLETKSNKDEKKPRRGKKSEEAAPVEEAATVEETPAQE